MNIKWVTFEANDAQWDELLASKGCGSFFQFSGWARHKSKAGWQLRRFVCEKDQKIVGAVQILLKKKGPILIAWAPGGPIGPWELIESGFIEQFQKSIEGVQYYLRIKPSDESQKTPTSMFRPSRQLISSPWTMHLDLSLSEEDMHKNLSQNWRHNLKRALKLKVCATIESLRALEVHTVLAQTEDFKAIAKQFSYKDVESLTTELNIIHAVARNSDGVILALRSAVLSKKFAWDIFAGSSLEGRKCYASNLVAWKLFNECKSLGISTYDLMGVDPHNNPGVYNFKKGTGANLITYPGELEYSSFRPISWALNLYLRGKDL